MDSKPDRARDTLDRAANQAKEALKEIRNSITVLRDQPDENIPLETKLKGMIKQLEDSQITATLTIRGDIPVLPSQFEHTIYRTVQEGIQNCLKHAKAKHLWITLDYLQNRKFSLEIRDDGLGAAESSGGFGLIGIRERVVLQKGEFRTGNHPDGGFYIIIEVPYERDSETTHRG
jgi:signal transduction histidine kinase